MRQRFPRDHPVVYAVLLLLLIVAVYGIDGAITTIFALPPLAFAILGDGMLAVSAIVLLTLQGWWRAAGFRLPPASRVLWWFVVPVLPVVDNVVGGGLANPGIASILLFSVVAMTSGFVEEAFFRGLMLHALLVRGPWLAAILSSALFGVTHLLNVASGANLASTAVQMVYAFGLGFLYAALVLRTGTLLPLILLHGLTNVFGNLLQNGTVNTAGVNPWVLMYTAAEVVLFAGVGAILVRQVAQQRAHTERAVTASPVETPSRASSSKPR